MSLTLLLGLIIFGLVDRSPPPRSIEIRSHGVAVYDDLALYRDIVTGHA